MKAQSEEQGKVLRHIEENFYQDGIAVLEPVDRCSIRLIYKTGNSLIFYYDPGSGLIKTREPIYKSKRKDMTKMPKKKSFKDNPALQFISTDSPADSIAEKDEEPAPQYPMKRNPLYIETKSRRVQLMFQPSLYNKIKALATEQGKSINDTIHTILDEHINGKDQ